MSTTGTLYHELQTPIGPDLPIAAARRFAIDRIDTAVSSDPKLITAFWDEINGSASAAPPDITVFYCFLRFEGSTFTLLEFVSGQTLKQLCTEEDPIACERVIPLFAHFLDAYERAPGGRSPRGGQGKQAIELTSFGIARAKALVKAKLHGTMLIRPDGSWSEEILNKENGRSEAYPLLVAVYKELIGQLPKGTPLAPAQLTSFSKCSLTKPVAPRISRRFLPFLTAVGACALLLLCLFGAGRFLAQRVKSRQTGGLNLPQMPAIPVAEPEPAITPEPDSPTLNAAKDTVVITKAGMSRGPRLIHQVGPRYPDLARKKKISGVVKLEITVAEDGSVYKAKVLSGNPLLAAGAAEAVKKWVYQPALVNGKRSSSTTEVEIKFDLDAAL